MCYTTHAIVLYQPWYRHQSLLKSLYPTFNPYDITLSISFMAAKTTASLNPIYIYYIVSRVKKLYFSYIIECIWYAFFFQYHTSYQPLANISSSYIDVTGWYMYGCDCEKAIWYSLFYLHAIVVTTQWHQIPKRLEYKD